MIHFCDSGKAVIGEVYQRMSDMLSEIKEALLDHWELSDIMEDLINFRWEKMNRPLHCLAYVLTPHYYSQAWLRGMVVYDSTIVFDHLFSCTPLLALVSAGEVKPNAGVFDLVPLCSQFP
ncbi:hypothetical protein IFM89_011513 [Coptis chinensis]|uniref:Uncharacterized protein n=1 Tax=Coptis chinensis TaxID=261450 RepID=A0A835IBK2_9MAGN|nr:hypothetical protein IFM89_011513 [Coptis chinensis]